MWLTIHEFAKKLGVSDSAIRDRVRRGTLKSAIKSKKVLKVLWEDKYAKY